MTEPRWVHCPCGKRLVKLVPPACVHLECPRCGMIWRIGLTREGMLTILPSGTRLVTTEEAG